MQTLEIVPVRLQKYVHSVFMLESQDPNAHTNLPFYADGLPGIMFQQSEKGCFLLPKNKKLSEFFLYGQTIAPISLDIKGPFRFIVFQLFPFVSKYLLNVHPKELNDACYDLLQLKDAPFHSKMQLLRKTENINDCLTILVELLATLIANHKANTDDRIQNAIFLILQNKGQFPIKAIRQQVFLTERTLERMFVKQVGLTPKQFSKIIQFKSSLDLLNQTNFKELIAVGLDSGFSDQSHFIRVFKRYTGKTPSRFLKAQTS